MSNPAAQSNISRGDWYRDGDPDHYESTNDGPIAHGCVVRETMDLLFMEQWIYCLVMKTIRVVGGGVGRESRRNSSALERWIYCSWNNGSIVWSNNRLLFYYENALLSSKNIVGDWEGRGGVRYFSKKGLLYSIKEMSDKKNPDENEEDIEVIY